MFEDISNQFSEFKLQEKPRPYQRRNRRSRRNSRNNSNLNNNNGGRQTSNIKNQQKRGKNNGKRTRRRKKKLSAEEIQMAEGSTLDASAARFDSAFEWKPPMFLSPFAPALPSAGNKDFEWNTECDEFVPSNQ